ncbi:MAG: hypothetical protein ACRD9W_16695 [Terriglobia bacterium]
MSQSNALRYIIIVVALMAFSPAKAVDDGNSKPGDCCSTLEDQIARLEQKVDKGNAKVSVTVSGWVAQSANWWGDGVGQSSKPPQR